MPGIFRYIIEGLREDLRRLCWALRYVVAVLLDFMLICVTRIREFDLEANIPQAGPHEIELEIVHGIRHRLPTWGVLAPRSPQMSLEELLDELERIAEDEEEDEIEDWDAWGEELV